MVKSVLANERKKKPKIQEIHFLRFIKHSVARITHSICIHRTKMPEYATRIASTHIIQNPFSLSDPPNGTVYRMKFVLCDRLSIAYIALYNGGQFNMDTRFCVRCIYI